MGAHSTLMLKAGSTVVLSQYVNQKVELTGTMEPSAGSMTSSGSTTSGQHGRHDRCGHHGHDRHAGAGTTAGTTGATASGSATGSASTPTLNVTNVKVVSKTCS